VPKKQLTSEVLIDLHRRLSVLPSRSHERRIIMQETARLYGISEQTLYRALAQRARPKALRSPSFQQNNLIAVWSGLACIF
jgi:hypothetical protein